MPRALRSASVVSVPVLVAPRGWRCRPRAAPDVDWRAVGAPLWRNLQGSRQALARRLDPYAADVWHGAAPIDERLVPQRSSLAGCTTDPVAPAAMTAAAGTLVDQFAHAQGGQDLLVTVVDDKVHAQRFVVAREVSTGGSGASARRSTSDGRGRSEVYSQACYDDPVGGGRRKPCQSQETCDRRRESVGPGVAGRHL